ncbi:MAG TPA: cysteine dioxygenase family protein [Anaerolineae bacterium]|nr:cysteine dioxygenase family protein [Anaerolineae bacterium]
MNNIPTINDLDHLVDFLNQCRCQQDFISLVHHLQLNHLQFRPYHSWSQDYYTRNLVARTDEYELLVLCWDEGQVTPIHNHQEQDCWMYLLEGQIMEKQYHVFDETGQELHLEQVDQAILTNQQAISIKEGSHTILNPGQAAYINDDIALHALHNIHPGRSVTLHLYAKPINECYVYSQADSQFKRRYLSYHTTQPAPLPIATD